MVLKYTWLKILDVLRKSGSKLSAKELKADLDGRGFFLTDEELADDLAKMVDDGLVETDLMATTDGGTAVAVDEYSRLGITPAGVRKLTAIVKI